LIFANYFFCFCGLHDFELHGKMKLLPQIANLGYGFRIFSIRVEDCGLACQAADAFLTQFVEQVGPALELFLTHVVSVMGWYTIHIRSLFSFEE